MRGRLVDMKRLYSMMRSCLNFTGRTRVGRTLAERVMLTWRRCCARALGSTTRRSKNGGGYRSGVSVSLYSSTGISRLYVLSAGWVEDADINAARNILHKALAGRRGPECGLPAASSDSQKLYLSTLPVETAISRAGGFGDL